MMFLEREEIVMCIAVQLSNFGSTLSNESRPTLFLQYG